MLSADGIEKEINFDEIADIAAAADIDVAEVSVFDDNVNDDGDDLIVEQIDSKEVECLPASLGTTMKAGAKNRSEGNMNFLLTFFFLLLRHYSYSNILIFALGRGHKEPLPSQEIVAEGP